MGGNASKDTVVVGDVVRIDTLDPGADLSLVGAHDLVNMGHEGTSRAEPDARVAKDLVDGNTLATCTVRPVSEASGKGTNEIDSDTWSNVIKQCPETHGIVLPQN